MKKTIVLALLACFCLAVKAQNWIGLSAGNRAGINGIYLNPATIVDNRLAVHINLFGTGTNVYNNYISFSGEKTLLRYIREGDTLGVKNTAENLNGKDKVLNFSNEMRGPSFMVSLHPKHAIAFSTRSRVFLQAVDVSQPIARMIRWGLDDSTQGFEGPDGLNFEELYNQTRFGINVNAFTEIGFTYATVLLDNKKHFLKAGITYKHLSGLYTFYLKNEGGNGVKISGDDSLTFDNTNISYGYMNEGFYRNQSGDFDNPSINQLFGTNRIGKGFGLDVGVTYELRPDYEKYKYTLDGKERWDKTKNKYLLRVSGTLMDFGQIRYSNQQYIKNNVIARNKVVTWGSLDTVGKIFDNFDSLGPGQSVFTRFDSAVGTVFGFESQSNEIISKLPTAINLQADVKVVDNVYVNVLWLQGLRKKGAIGSRQFSMLALTPRYETDWFEASVPLALSNGYRNFTLGAMLRFGPVYIGSDNISGLIRKKNVYGLDFYAGLYVPIYKRNPRDRDKDGVSDRRDRCKREPGLWEFEGCPDRDRDSIEDAKDKCPDVAGLPQFEGCPDRDGDGLQDTKDECPDVPGDLAFNGCPDTDGDGVEDRLDSCVTVKGLPKYNGCPDTDSDGIIDLNDECPEEAGLPVFNGCPDRDSDGVRDIDDKCVDKAGLPEFKGCPDTDKDNIPDNLDKCPDVFGIVAFGGCPDTDGDGVPDHKDLCPMEAGLPENNGCPKVAEQIEIVELAEEEEKVLREAFDNLEFETGKSVIRPESFASLDELAELLKVKTAYRIYIAGHTDNVGNKKANQKLSENRANAVKAYLVSKGIEDTRIKTEGFGDARPVDTNKTPEGRQKNRRVEFKVIK